MILLGILFFIAMRSSSSLPFEVNDYEPNAGYPTDIIEYEYYQYIDDQSTTGTDETLINLRRELKPMNQRQIFQLERTLTQLPIKIRLVRSKHCRPVQELSTVIKNDFDNRCYKHT